MNIQAPALAESAAVRAGGSSFYLAMRILRRDQRKAMFEVYSFCRAVDDIADGTAPRQQRLARLAGWRKDIDALYVGEAPQGLEGLAQAVAEFKLGKSDVLDVIDGMEMDAAADIRAPELAQLERYCDRVACAVGRLSVRIFGMEDSDGKLLAHHLGQALQLTNILRDIDEDAAAGRLYLPREALQLAGIDSTEPETAVSHPRLETACAFVVDRARGHFAASDRIMARNPRRLVRAPRIMAEVYRQMLEDMVARGWARPRRRVHVHKSHLLWIALRHAFI
jgi:phytoene synthase